MSVIVEDGFRLAGAPSDRSLKSKARIDALFEDTRSVCSSTLGGWYAEVNLPAMAFGNLDEVGAEEQKRVNSAVQARIEAMFASVEAETGIPGECAAAILPVRYLGAAPVGGRVASVRGLQEPLRDLLGRLEESLPAELEVSRRGLTFRTSESLEKTNPFRRIAVWSALRLRSKKLQSGEVHYAFVPLVGDDSVSSCGDDKHADLYKTMRGLRKGEKTSPPIFAVVMRRPGVVRLLECHAFVCQVEEDAVAAAATLYRALLADLDANRRRPRQANGVGCMSLASAASLASSISVRETIPISRNLLGPPPPRPTAPHPIRPPRIKKSSSSSAKDEGNSSSSGLENGKFLDVKAEDILEGRSRRSSISISSALPLSLGIEEKREKRDTVDQKVLKENNKNIITRPKSVISVRDGQENFWNSDDHGEYEMSKKNSKIDTNFRMRGQSFSHNVNNHDKMLNLKTDKLDDTKQSQKDNISFVVTQKSNASKRPSTNDEEGTNGKQKGSYNLSKNQEENIYSSRKHDYSNHGSIIIERSNSQMKKTVIYSHRNEKNIKHKGDGQLYIDQHFKDADKIFSLDNQENDYEEKSGKPKRFHPQNSESERIPSRQSSTTKSTNKNSPSKVPEYSEPRSRRGSRAGSEPPRIGRSEDSGFSTNQQESRLKKAQSDLDLDGGDLLTRVELPRRGSFLHSNNTRKPDNFQGGTPLGFTELFDEFRNQEGLTSVDDILAAIIDPEGMSFNDLKPLYKEFLLKLAATLTRDELYERSASIMRRRRRPQRGRASRRPCLLGRAIKRSVSRLKGGPTEFTSVIFPARKLNDSLGSSSSCDVRNNNRNRVLASRLSRKKSSRRRAKPAIGHTTSEDSDTCRRFGRGVTANRSSSGYVSCSECSYDSESCTCVSADKCYCSLSRRVSVAEIPVATVMCSCDTDSCSESNKCYCARKLPVRQPTILEQLRQRGIVPSESTLSRNGSPQVIRTLRTNKSYSSSRSLEFLKVRPRASSSDNLALDYDLFSPGKNPQSASSDSDKVLVVGARDPQGRLIYVGGTGRGKRTPSNGTERSRTHHEALSIKKSAEIAAVFGNSAAKTGRRPSNASSLRSSASLEAGLGYLP